MANGRVRFHLAITGKTTHAVGTVRSAKMTSLIADVGNANIQPQYAMTIGKGYTFIRNGRTTSGRRDRSHIGAMICPMKWSETRAMVSALITSSRSKKLASAANRPINNTSNVGNPSDFEARRRSGRNSQCRPLIAPRRTGVRTHLLPVPATLEVKLRRKPNHPPARFRLASSTKGSIAASPAHANRGFCLPRSSRRRR